jgi:pimeloyl-ACP methyl ester carboxylesterase
MRPAKAVQQDHSRSVPAKVGQVDGPAAVDSPELHAARIDGADARRQPPRSLPPVRRLCDNEHVAGAFGAVVERSQRPMDSATPVFHPDMRAAELPIWREALVGLDWLALRSSPVFYGLGVSRGDGSAVVVVPGFLGSDLYLHELYCWLRRIGYRPFMSRIGRNADCLDVLTGRLLATVEAAGAESGGRVHLVGHSLGGMLARSVAARHPGRVASVATLGSPFRGIRSHPLVLRATDVVRRRIQSERGGERPACYTGHCACQAVAGLRAGVPGSVRQIAVFTRTDGIVDWRSCVTGDRETDVEVPGTHVGLVFNASVYRRLAAHLARVDSAASPDRPAHP